MYVFIFGDCFAKLLITAWELGLTFLFSASSTSVLRTSLKKFPADISSLHRGLTI